ncbi:homoserine dehydrogenase [Pontibacillus yanchengensis]|uniref:Homoserine dehydrogenase n=1 Tax=Pontibacillus yanchengensis TaxID=462910 RepID=A0ACC7VI64_9BACI|nr:homoserine dehydrogenase [Pontibacillus yanchengensis]MYL53634.1 homoserine dehydrogenase [Pontibacillus yanchengensis]
MTIKIAILGLGTVGQGVYETLLSHDQYISEKLGTDTELVGVLVNDSLKQRNLPNHIPITTNYHDILSKDVDVIIEATVGDHPAFEYLSQAIQKGIHVITANKAMFARYGKQLIEKATENQVHIGYEATTASGTPILRTLKQLLQVNQIEKMEAILNGTSNYILTEMTMNHTTFEEALVQAQEKGFAEANPSNDVDGNDAFYKSMILSQLVYDLQPNWEDVYREGIGEISNEQIQHAAQRGQKIKHIATVEMRNGEVAASIQPMQIDDEHPLYSVDGVNNGITVHTDLLGTFTLTGPGAGKLPTASAIIEDLVYVFHKEIKLEKQYIY